MEEYEQKINKILIDIYISEYTIVDGIIEEIEMSDGKIEKFCNDKTSKWNLSEIIIFKNTDTINDLEQQLLASFFHDDRILFHNEIKQIKNTIFSYLNLPTNIKKITFKVQLIHIF